MVKHPVDYSFYFVTDPTNENYIDVIQQCVDNGATIVQLREKHLDTGAIVSKAREVHEITQKAGIPLIINDRVDVCLAMGAEGVHVGFDDMIPCEARRLLGPDKILGVSVHDLDELKFVLEDGSADYIGIGAVYDTSTKKLKQAPTGPQGVRQIIKYLVDHKIELPSVIIGGLSVENSAPSIIQSSYKGVKTNGVAVVSCISQAAHPGEASKQLRSNLDAVYKTHIPQVIQSVYESPPVILHVTNTVVQNFSANVTLAIGASPIMSYEDSEFADLSLIPGSAVVVNTGSPKVSDTMYATALQTFKSNGKHVVFDPVGCGATGFRRALNKELFLKYKPNIVKCNAGEIISLIKLCEGSDGSEETTVRGVDSTVLTEPLELIALLKQFCSKYQCIAAITGEVDVVCSPDGHSATVAGGDPLLTRITGTGCSLSGVVASYVAHVPLDDLDTAFHRTVDALASYKHCGRRASLNSKGPGSFHAQFLNELYNLKNITTLECVIEYH